ncbi:dTDP-4-dehydrorhamnose reductase [Paraburkholderia phenoliruptrix]|uniref:dTDP-4-dehydrorhamnose reductase n=1 Tax=Paraburkholderia phenoliruptrix TaxID=252970 RepID=A0ABV3WBU3_9BURK
MREGGMGQQANILVTGINGQVGYELLRSLQGLGRVIGLDRAALNLESPDAIRRVVREVKPTIIVNPAAYTAVDRAENDVEGAQRLNVQAPALLAEEAKRLGAALVHYSTDYVFDGTKDTPYVETDAVNPQNVYGKTKLEGEREILASGCDHLILRTSWVYGMRGKNFLLTMLKLGAERDELSVVADQIGAPTWSRTIATLTAHVLVQATRTADLTQWWAHRSGVYHLTASGATSWQGFAEAIFELSSLGKRPVVQPIPASSYPTPAMRPANSRISNDKLASTFGVRAPDWREALALCMQ